MNNTICSGAWTDININFFDRFVRHCCRANEEFFPHELNSTFFNQSQGVVDRRIDLINGKQHHQCSKCWKDYETTGTAYRDIKNEWTTINDVSDKIKTIEIFLDNTCDMSCVYCCPNDSSKIAREQGISFKNSIIQNDIDEFFIWLKTIQLDNIGINFLGGEVTASKNFYNFVERLKMSISADIHIGILTNCNTNQNNMNKIINCFDNLPSNWDINLSISNESVQPSKLIRWGLNWDKFSKNFETYLNHPKINYICLSPSPSIFSIKYMYEYFEWVFEIVKKTNKKCMVFGNWVQNPGVLDPARCKKDYKIYIDRLENLFLSNEDIFKSGPDTDKTGSVTFAIKWLKKLKNRIGTVEPKLDELDEWFNEMYMFKKDKQIYNLKQYL